MHENEVPLIIVKLQIHWVVSIWFSGWGGSLSHDEEFGLLTLPWGGFVNFFFFWFHFHLYWACGLSFLLFLWFGIIIKVIKIWELLFGIDNYSLWNKLLDSERLHFEAYILESIAFRFFPFFFSWSFGLHWGSHWSWVKAAGELSWHAHLRSKTHVHLWRKLVLLVLELLLVVLAWDSSTHVLLLILLLIIPVLLIHELLLVLV